MEKSNKKIVVVQNLDLYPDQKERLKTLGDVTFYDDVPTIKQWLKRVEDADIVCSDLDHPRNAINQTKNKFYSFPFVMVGWIDKEKIRERDIQVANSPGCNKDAVSEWIVAMTINLLRGFFELNKLSEAPKNKILDAGVGLTGKKITILGKGNVGGRVGHILESFEAQVEYFEKGDDLIQKTKDALVVINTLSTNDSTIGLLDKDFFDSLNGKSYFVSVTSSDIYDTDAMFASLDNGKLAGAAVDFAGMGVGDVENEYYKKLCVHNRILATPHIAFNTDVSSRIANDMMIDNIEAYLAGKSIHLVE